MSTASDLLIEARSRTSLGQAELARRAGIPRSVLNAYERCRREPGVAALARLLAAAGFRLELQAEPGFHDDRACRILSHVLDLAQALPRRRRGVLTFPGQPDGGALAGQLVAIHEALAAAGFSHAYGGAIALAFCANEAHVTLDLAVRVFVEEKHADCVLAALPDGVSVDPIDVTGLTGGPVRAWWADVPFDLFFEVDDFDRECASRVRSVPFADTTIPVLDASCLVVLKAVVGRSKEWVDIEAIAQVGALDVEFVLGWAGRLLGADHPSTVRLASLVR